MKPNRYRSGPVSRIRNMLHHRKGNYNDMNPSTLSDAITGVEQASSAYTAASTTTVNDQASAAAIQAKLDAANQQIATDQQAQSAAATAFNSSLDALIAAANAAKV